MASMKFVVWPEDELRDWRMLRNVMRAVRDQLRATRKPQAIEIKAQQKGKTLPQNSTLWMWHTEIASQLTERCREAGHQTSWSKDDVHELVFKARFMPLIQKELPTGEVVGSRMNTSDKDCTAEVISAAMEHYLSWIYGQGLEVTIPEDPGMVELCRRCA